MAVDDESLNNVIGASVSLNIIDGSASAGNVADSDPDGSLDLGSIDLDPSTSGVQSTLAVAGEGDWSVDAAGVATFTPEATFTSDPTPIPYTVSDNDGNTSNTATITVDYVGLAPGLTVTKSGTYNGVGALGDTISYVITVTNSGNVTVFDTVVTDTQADAGSITYDPADDAEPDGDIDALASGASAQVTATRTITQTDLDAGSVTNTATATGQRSTGDRRHRRLRLDEPGRRHRRHRRPDGHAGSADAGTDTAQDRHDRSTM